MYQMQTRVRYSEVETNKQVGISQIVNYFQDCSTFQSEDIGQGIVQLEESNRAWFLCGWQIEVERYPMFGEMITIQTWPYDRTDLYAYRNFLIKDVEDQIIARANSIWFLVDTISGKPIRITDQDVEMYGTGEPLSMEYENRKIRLPKEMQIFDSFFVMKAHIDTNNHVNNSQYILFAQEFLPQGFEVKKMRADYKKAAKLHDEIIPKVWYGEKHCIVQLCDKENKTYVVIEFKS